MRVQLSLYNGAASVTYYYAPLIPCYLKGANWVVNATQSAGNKTVVIALSGGSTICSGTAVTAGTAVEGTMTTTEAYLKQVISKTTPLTIAVDFASGSAATLCVDLDFDEFKATV
jgi:Fe-S cluster biogenesis protein NfuA